MPDTEAPPLSHAILATYGIPEALVGTKPSVSGPVLCTGSARDLRHDCWVIRTADPAKLMGADVPFDFAQPVVYGGARLTDPAFDFDLLTAKIVALEAMRGQYLTSLATAVAPARLRYLVWFFRWRNDIGVGRTELVEPAMFEDFCERLKGGLPNVVALERRFATFEQRVADEGWSWACRTVKDGLPELDFDAVAAQLGVSIRALVDSPLYGRLLKLISDTDATIYRRTAKADVDAALNALSAGDYAPTIDHAHKALMPWRWLQDLSAVGLLEHDRLGFDPFQDVGIVARAKMIGRTPRPGEGRTGTPGPEQWLALLDGAARWVLDYAGPVLAICEEARKKYEEMAVGTTVNSRTGKARKHIPVARLDEYREHVQAIIDARFPAAGPGLPRLLPLWRRGVGAVSDRRVDMVLEEALRYVVTACLILIGGMSARRRGEVESLKAGCAQQDHFGNWWLSSYIEKTVRDIDRIPVPAMTGAAVRILEDLSRSAREASGEGWLLRIHRPVATINTTLRGDDEGGESERAFLKTRLDTVLAEFAEMLGVDREGNQQAWVFKPHQLRRAFSVYYYHGNRFSSLDALSRFLRHFDPEMTRRYITEAIPGALMRLREVIDARQSLADAGDADPLLAEARDAVASLEERGKAHEEVRQESLVERVVEMYDGLENPIGRGAAGLYDDLEALIEQARVRVRLDGQSNVSPDREREALVKILREFAPSRRVEPHPGRHAHCGLMPGDQAGADDAVCLRNRRAETGQSADGGGPDYAYAATADCLGCRFGIAFSENVVVINDRVRRTEEAAAKAPNEQGREAARAKLSEIKDKLAAAKAAVRGRHRG